MNGIIAVVICNYNKKEYVKKNIESLQRQTMKLFDVFVVDNASTDGSADEIEKTFKREIKVIRNTCNLGGSGGFNTGIREAMKYDYQYIVLLDNDVVLKEDALKVLYDDMRDNEDIGILGAKIMKMDYPDIIQEFAPTINFSTLNFELNHGGEEDKGRLPHIVDCDYVPACALMVRREVVEKIGCMPDENFIYYDDIEWGIRCKRAGYRVAADSLATVWHKGGALVNPTTFATYYLNRNKIYFFMRYMMLNKPAAVSRLSQEERIDAILRDIYEGIYSCEYRGVYNVAKTRMDALLDAINGMCGKAEPYKIRHREIIDEKFDMAIMNARSVRIYMNGLWECTRRILYHIKSLESKYERKIKIELTDNITHDQGELLGEPIYSDEHSKDEDFDLVFHVCKHIYEIEIMSLNNKWVDGWRNTIFDANDFESYRAFHHGYEVFKLCMADCLKEAMNRIAGDYSYVEM